MVQLRGAIAAGGATGFRSCAHPPGCAKLRGMRRQTFIFFAIVLVAAGNSLGAGAGVTLNDTEELRLRAARPGAVV